MRTERESTAAKHELSRLEVQCGFSRNHECAAVLGAALVAYLLAVHLAESGGSARTLRPQVRVLAAGAALLALGAGAGMLSEASPGAGSALLRLVAAGALIAAAGLVLPHAGRDDAPPPPPA